MKPAESTRRGFLEQTGLIGLALLARPVIGRGQAAGPSTVRVRKGIDEFVKDPASLEALRAGVAKMRSLEPDHPFSWIFQANIHWRPFYPDYVYAQADASADPGMRLFRDKTGFAANPDVFNQCPHGNWWFLPWHRAYLYHFERILRWAANAPDLTLPYWNYSDANQHGLPEVFRQPTYTPQGATAPVANPLYLPDIAAFTDETGAPAVFPMRDAPLNGGLTQLSAAATALGALNVVPFTTSPPTPSTQGFGSPRTCDTACNCRSGAVENIPHNVVHNAIGGNAVEVGRSLRVGFMGDISTAARDPIFWLHHANIDRLWESWLVQTDGGKRMNPDDPEWLTRQFTFFDYDDNDAVRTPIAVTVTPADLLSTTDLGYKYDRLEGTVAPVRVAASAVLLGAAPPTETLAATKAPTRAPGARHVQPHAMPGMEPAGIALKTTTSTQVSLPLATGVTAERLSEAAAPGQDKGDLVLSLEGINFEQNPGVVYEVYLGLPQNAEPTHESPYYVNTLTFFGSKHPVAPHQGHARGDESVTERFSLPPALRGLIQDRKIDLAKLAVTFVPRTGTEPVAGKQNARAKPAAERVVVTIQQVRISRNR